ncbi:hypothetical protein ACUUL3_00280 [Thiovibrio sp. JS02]
MLKRISLSVILSAFLTLLCASQVFAGRHEDLVNKYIELSGFNEILAAFPEQIEAVAAQNQLTSKHPSLDNKVTAIMKESFDLKHAEKNLSLFLLQNTDIDYLEKLLKWMETPLAKKIKNEELASSGPESQAELLRYIAELQSDPPSQERVAVIHEVERTTGLSELTANIVIDMMRGMFESFNLALPEENRQALAIIEEEITKNKAVIQESLRQQMILTSFYSYRNISNEELVQYINFYKTDVGKREIAVTGSALSYVLRHWFVDVGEKIVGLANEQITVRNGKKE